MKEAHHPPLDAEAILGVLEAHQVTYVLVGGYAAELHGSVRRTVDVDAVPETSRENLTRLAAALRQLGARIRTDADPAGMPFTTSAEALVGMTVLNLVTDHGELDLTFTPSGTQGYADLNRAAAQHAVGRVQVQVAALADAIRPKTAAGRSKDLVALPELRRLAAGRASAGPAVERVRETASDTTSPVADGPPDAGDQWGPDRVAAARIAAARSQAAADRRQRRKPPSSGSGPAPPQPDQA